MTWPWGRMLLVLLVAATDVIVYFTRQSDETAAGLEPVSYPAHISGAAIGLLAGITFLKNLHWERFERYVWAGSAFIAALMLVLPIVFSLASPEHYMTVSDLCSSAPTII